MNGGRGCRCGRGGGRFRGRGRANSGGCGRGRNEKVINVVYINNPNIFFTNEEWSKLHGWERC